jgi:hypothetical protein
MDLLQRSTVDAAMAVKTLPMKDYWQEKLSY